MLRLALGVAALTGRSSAFLIAPALSRPTTHAPHTLMCDGSGTHGGHRQTHADEGEATPLEEVKVVGFSELGALDLTPATLADPDTPPPDFATYSSPSPSYSPSYPPARSPAFAYSKRASDKAREKAKDGGGKPTKRGRKSAPQLGALPPVGNLLQHLEPERVLVESYNLDSLPDLPNCSHGNTFVELFRSCTPYIRMHQSKIVVIHVSSLLLEKNVLFNELMQDINSPTHPLFPTCRTPFPPYVRN